MMSQYPFVSIIIPTRNSEQYITECLQSIEALTYPAKHRETIIVDGESTDRTVEIASSMGAIVMHGSCNGPTHDRMKGFSHAKGEIIAFTDADAIVDAEWLTNAVHILTNEPNITVVGGPTLHPPQGYIATTAQVIFDIFAIAKLTNNSSTLHVRRTMEKIGHVNFVLRAKSLSNILPHKWVGYGGDVAMCHALREKGGILIQDPNVIVSHYKRTSIAALFHELFEWGKGGAHNRMTCSIHDFLNYIAGLALPLGSLLILTIVALHGVLPLLVGFKTIILIGIIFGIIIGIVKRSWIVGVLSPFIFTTMLFGWSCGLSSGIVLNYKNNIRSMPSGQRHRSP